MDLGLRLWRLRVQGLGSSAESFCCAGSKEHVRCSKVSLPCLQHRAADEHGLLPKTQW